MFHLFTEERNISCKNNKRDYDDTCQTKDEKLIKFVKQKLALTVNSDATLDVITSNLMFLTHYLMFDVFADESDVKQSGC